MYPPALQEQHMEAEPAEAEHDTIPHTVYTILEFCHAQLLKIPSILALALQLCRKAHACIPACPRAETTTLNQLLRWMCRSIMHFTSISSVQLTKFSGILSCSASAGSDPIMLLLQCWRVHACTPAVPRAETPTLHHLRWVCCSRMHFISSGMVLAAPRKLHLIQNDVL